MPDDHRLSAITASHAAELLIQLRRGHHGSGSQLGKIGDAHANELILDLLRAARPEDGFLSEESAPDPSRLSKRRVWIIDPLDGTREYAERERDDWAVHIALTECGLPSACAVALPALGLIYSTASPVALPPLPACPLKILVSRSRPPALAERVAAKLGAELVPMGSAGAKAMAVLRGEAHAYLHAGGLSEWDSCAPVGVALASGLHASRIDGSPCLYNQPDISMPDLLICRPECAPALLAAIAAAIEPGN